MEEVKTYTLAVEVKIPSRERSIINPLRTDLEFAGWALIDTVQGRLYTTLTYELEVEANGDSVENQVIARMRATQQRERMRDSAGASSGHSRRGRGSDNEYTVVLTEPRRRRTDR